MGGETVLTLIFKAGLVVKFVLLVLLFLNIMGHHFFQNQTVFKN